MGRAHRPRRTKKDQNHEIVRHAVNAHNGVYHGLKLRIIDTADLASSTGLLDWLLWIGPLAIMIEIKSEGKKFVYTKGERRTINDCFGIIPVEVAIEIQDVLDIFEKYAPLALQAEQFMGFLCQDMPVWWEIFKRREK